MRDEAFILSNVLVSSSSSATQSNPSPGQARRPGMKAAARSTTDLPDPAFAARQAKTLLVHARLCTEYGALFPFFSTKDQSSELVPCSRTAPLTPTRTASTRSCAPCCPPRKPCAMRPPRPYSTPSEPTLGPNKRLRAFRQCCAKSASTAAPMHLTPSIFWPKYLWLRLEPGWKPLVAWGLKPARPPCFSAPCAFRPCPSTATITA